MICFYHNADLDGKCSGYLVKNKFPYCKLYGIDHGDRFPWDLVEENENIVMVDFSLQPFSNMIELYNKAKSLIWIDHHISAIEEEKHSTIKIEGKRNNGKAACELVWEYFYPTQKIPYFVHLLSKYDVWDHSNPDVLPFQYGMKLKDTSIWQEPYLISDKERSELLVNSIITEGKVVLKYIEQDYKEYVEKCSFNTLLCGFRCIAVNRMMVNSKIFDSVWDEDKYDIMITFGWRKGQWIVGLYTTKEDIDVSIIAKRFDGGGHAKAAGFQCMNLPFELKEIEAATNKVVKT